MKNSKIIFLTLSAFLISSFAQAQIEVAYVQTKDYTAIGYGAFLNFSIPVSEGSAITAEAAAYFFRKKDEGVVLVPMVLGYRYTFNGTGTGLYVEPNAGYNIGGTDFYKTTPNGSPVIENGEYVNLKAKGITAGLSTGYILPGNTPLNFTLRYQRVFVSEDPSFNVFSFRVSYPMFHRKEE